MSNTDYFKEKRFMGGPDKRYLIMNRLFLSNLIWFSSSSVPD